MLGTHDLVAFVVAGFMLNLTPGPDTMYIIARTISQGRKAGILSVLGISSGCAMHTLFAAFGLSAILATSATAFLVVQYVGAGYLIFLGIQTLRKKSKPITEATPATKLTSLAVYRQGFVTNLLNPKVALFFLAFLPQFVMPDADLGPVPFLFLGSLFISTGTLWCFVLVLGASYATQAIRSNQRIVAVLDKLTGVVFIALGLNLLRAKPQAA